MAEIINTANLTGFLGAMELVASSTVTVLMSDVSLIKTADQEQWNNDLLMYTIVARNLEEAGGITATGVVITDTIDPGLATLVENTVLINGDEPVDPVTVTFVIATGLLTISGLEIEPETTVTITFQVRKV